MQLSNIENTKAICVEVCCIISLLETTIGYSIFRNNSGVGVFINLIEKAVSNGSFLVIRNIDEAIDHLFHPLIYILLAHQEQVYQGNFLLLHNVENMLRFF